MIRSLNDVKKNILFRGMKLKSWVIVLLFKKNTNPKKTLLKSYTKLY